MEEYKETKINGLKASEVVSEEPMESSSNSKADPSNTQTLMSDEEKGEDIALLIEADESNR